MSHRIKKVTEHLKNNLVLRKMMSDENNNRNLKYIGRGIAAAVITVSAAWLEISGIKADGLYVLVVLLVFAMI